MTNYWRQSGVITIPINWDVESSMYAADTTEMVEDFVRVLQEKIAILRGLHKDYVIVETYPNLVAHVSDDESHAFQQGLLKYLEANK